jgi:cobalt/nickel transport system permease protein
VGAGHAHRLFLDGDTPLHRLASHCKLAATFLFVLAVVATPREAFFAYTVYALMLAVLARLGRVPFGFVARRLVIELPFVAFALFMPFVGTGERVHVAGLSLSIDGLWAAWNILVKGTLGVAASVLLAATTDLTDLLRGLERLRLPKAITTIAGFMVRYGDVIADDMRRMRIARVSRGHDPRWIWQARAVASTAGALFIRSFERGERVHLAMLSRGYTGSFPVVAETTTTGRAWALCLAVPAAAAVVCVTAWWVR